MTNRVAVLEAAASAPVTLLASAAAAVGGVAQQTLVTSYTPSYNGYIYFTVTSATTTTSYIRVTNLGTGSFTDTALAVGSNTFTVVLGAANSYSIIYGNTAAASTATVSAQFYRQ